MRQLERLQLWYDAQCDGEWEHAFAVTIDTLDNAGWWIKFQLKRLLVETLNRIENVSALKFKDGTHL